MLTQETLNRGLIFNNCSMESYMSHKTVINREVIDALFHNMIGFDRMPDILATQQQHKQSSFPPHTISRHKETKEYTVTLALVGYDKKSITIESKAAGIRISSEGAKVEIDENIDILHNGIATRSFKLNIPMHESLEVTNASFDNGMLTILINSKETIADNLIKID